MKPDREIWKVRNLIFVCPSVIHDCPHCGSEAAIYYYGNGTFLVGCPNTEWNGEKDCHCRGGHEDLARSISDWNKDCEKALREMENAHD